jgi:hypothetical protein
VSARCIDCHFCTPLALPARDYNSPMVSSRICCHHCTTVRSCCSCCSCVFSVNACVRVASPATFAHPLRCLHATVGSADAAATVPVVLHLSSLHIRALLLLLHLFAKMNRTPYTHSQPRTRTHASAQSHRGDTLQLPPTFPSGSSCAEQMAQ